MNSQINSHLIMLMKTTLTSQPLLNCQRQEDLVTYLYGEASAPERTRFELHLRECAACQDELKAFQNVRHKMSAWQPQIAPQHIASQLAPPMKSAQPLPSANLHPGQLLRELFQALPAWFRLTAAGMATATAALVLFSLLGTRININGNGVDIAFGKEQALPALPSAINSTAQNPATSVAVSSPDLMTRAEAEAMIREAVARTQSQERNNVQTQLSSLEQKLTLAHRAELKLATDKLRLEHRREIARLEPSSTSLREWMFTASETQETGDADEAKSN